MKETTIKLPFGLNKNGIIVHVNDVPRGKNCGCICPFCRSHLIAAKGSKNQHHFKHAVENECVSGLETAIHLAAKQILKKKKQIKLREFVLTESKIDSRGKTHSAQHPSKQSEAVIIFNAVKEEVKLNGIIADILATKNNKQLIIEIFCTNKVDDTKREKIIKTNISAIEINLSKLSF